MRLLVDACVARAVVDALRRDGFEVEWVAEWKRDPGDSRILQHAFEEGQVLITRDKDFGALVFRDNRWHKGVVRIVGEMTYAEQTKRLLQVLDRHVDDLKRQCLITIDADRVRVTQDKAKH